MSFNKRQGSTCSCPTQGHTMVMPARVAGAGTGHGAPLERGVEEALNVGRRAAVGAASWPARRVGGSEPPALPDGYDGGQRPPLPQGAQWGWRWPEHVHTPLEAQELTPRPAWCPGPTGTWNDLHHQAGLCPVPATTGTSSGPTVATSKGTHRIWPSVPSASSPHLAKEAEVACREQTQTHETRAPPAVKKTPASKKTNFHRQLRHY